MKEKMKSRKGFTLVELVVVIAILGILAAVAVPKLSSSRTNAAIGAHNANVRTLESAATMAIADGTGAVKWGGAKMTGKETEGNKLGWGNYVQEWPSLSNQLTGKKVRYEGESTEGEYTTLAAGEYTVDIGSDNSVTVTPGKIVAVSEEKEKTIN